MLAYAWLVFPATAAAVARARGLEVRVVQLGIGPPAASVVVGGARLQLGWAPLGAYVQVWPEEEAQALGALAHGLWAAPAVVAAAAVAPDLLARALRVLAAWAWLGEVDYGPWGALVRLWRHEDVVGGALVSLAVVIAFNVAHSLVMDASQRVWTVGCGAMAALAGVALHALWLDLT